MAVVAQGEIDLRLSKASVANLEKDLTKASQTSGGKSAQAFGKDFETGLKGFLGRSETALKNFAKTGEASLNPLNLLQSGAGKLGSTLEALGPVGAVAGAGVLALGAAAVAGVGKFESLAEKVYQFKAISGATAEQSSELVVALDEFGVSSDQVARGISRLARQATDGKEPLKDLGVTMARDKQGNFDAIGSFERIADAIHNSTDASRQNEIAFKAFGRAGVELIPLLERGSTAIKELGAVAKIRGEIFTDKDLAAAKQLSIDTRSLHDAFNSLEVSIGRDVVPGLTSLAVITTKNIDLFHESSHDLSTLISTGKGWRKNLDDLGDGLLAVVGRGRAFADVNKKGAATLTDLSEAEQKFADTTKANLDQVQGAIDDLSFSKSTTEQALLVKNVSLFGAAAEGVAITLNTDAKTGIPDYGKALAALNPIASRVFEDEYKISAGLDSAAAKFDLTAAAADELTQALNYTLKPFEDVKQAGFNLSETEKTLTEQIKGHPADLVKVQAASARLAVAQQHLSDVQGNLKSTTADLKKAQSDVATAQEALNKSQGTGATSTLDLQESALKLVEALQAVEDAQVRDSGGTINAAQAKQGLLDKLDAEIKKYPSLRTELTLYRDKIAAIPAEQLTDFKTQGLTGKDSVTEAVDNLNTTLRTIGEKAFHINFDTSTLDAANTKANALKTTLTAIANGNFTPPTPNTPSGLSSALIGPQEIALGRDLNGNGIIGRARGGPILPGVPYIVNEDTPRSEWFVSDAPGRIYTSQQASAPATGKGVSFGDIKIFEVAGDPRATAFAVMTAVAGALNK